ncbi:MAG: OmpA family protein [Vicinamibacterales bacterium]
MLFRDRALTFLILVLLVSGCSPQSADSVPPAASPAAAGPGTVSTPPVQPASSTPGPLGEPTRIPLIPGLTITAAIVHATGDSEAMLTITSVTPEAYRMTFSAEFPDDAGAGIRSVDVVRNVPMQDQRLARTMRNWYGPGDPETFPGTTPFFSGEIVNDLRREGRAALTLLVATSAATLGQTEVQALSGTVERSEPTPVGVPLLVNGRVVEVATIHATAKVAGGTITRSADLYVLDDPENPIIVRWRDESRNSRILKIDFPVAARVEQELTQQRTVDIYGIYFSFGSAAIRTESEPTLTEIADALRRHPDWRLQIDGHTDGIGNADRNLELSRQRSAAVREALIARFGIAADRLSATGRGESSPKASNDTSEGRGQNRRVELTRQ